MKKLTTGNHGANEIHAAVGHSEVVRLLPPTLPQHLYLGPIARRTETSAAED